MTLIEVKEVTRYFGDQKVLNKINITINKGDVIGLIGPNGSGKTTLLSIICGILNQTEGSILKKDYLRIGALIENPAFYNHLSAYQNLSLIAQIRNITNNDILGIIEKVGLIENKDKKYKAFSLGMKQRLGIAATLLNDPDIILLDEPTNGLDPFGIKEIREIIIKLHLSGKTIIVSSHILSEIEQLCSHILLLNKGEICFCDTKQMFLENANNIEDAMFNLISK